jgi:hypothetical protein
MQTKNEVEKEINNILHDVPDYLVLSHTSLHNNADKYAVNWFQSPNKDSYLSSTYNIKTTDIKDYKDIITFNGHKYKLDSCLLSSYFYENTSSHAIVGIHCNNNKYVYNGWDSNDKQESVISPCSLMQYDWNIKNKDSFCLDVKKCKLASIIKDKGLCFSFGKGNRLLVYVRIIDEKEEIIDNLNDYKSISKRNKIIKQIYNINKYTKTELIKQLKILNYTDIKDKSINDLRNILQIKIYKFYNIQEKDVKEKKEVKAKNETKLSIIEKIKTIKPDIKNLNIKKKEELLELYNKLQNGNYNNLSKKETKLSIIEKIKAIKPDIKNINKKKKEELLELYNKIKND